MDSFEWRQGEHVTIIGPTGAGKTTLAIELLHKRSYHVAFASKRRDTTMDKLLAAGFVRQERLSLDYLDHIVLWPPLDNRAHQDEQASVFQAAIWQLHRSGGWCIFVDEAAYLADDLHLARDLRMLWSQSRSGGNSVIACTQRPAFVPLLAYDSATHLFFFNDNDERNLQRIGGLGGMSANAVRSEVASLSTVPEQGGEILYVNTRTKQRLRTKVEVG